MQGLTFSEFDNIVGPALRFCYPPDSLSHEMFEDCLSDYSIVGQHLCGKFIAVKTDTLQFLSYPVAIVNPKYHRNTMLFSCGIVLDLDTDMDPYEGMLRKLSTTLISLELEQELLFNTARKNEKVPELLRMLYESIKSTGEAFINIDPYNTLSVRLFAPLVPPRTLGEYEVPLLRYDKRLISNLPWDVTLQHVLPMIDGKNFIKRIAFRADMDVDSVKRSLRVLLYYNCIIMTDIFRFSNRYQLTPGALRRILSSEALLQELEEFAATQVDQKEAVESWYRERQVTVGLRSRSDSYMSGTSIGSFSERLSGDSLGNSLTRSLERPIELGVSYNSPMVSSSPVNPSEIAPAIFEHSAREAEQRGMRMKGIVRFLLRLRNCNTVLDALSGKVTLRKKASTPTDHHQSQLQHEGGAQKGDDRGGATHGDVAGARTSWQEGDNDEQLGGKIIRQKSLLKYLEGVDMRRLIAFMQYKGLIRRMYEFPVRGCFPATASAVAGAPTAKTTDDSGATDIDKVGPRSFREYADYLPEEMAGCSDGGTIDGGTVSGDDDLEEVDEDEEEEDTEEDSAAAIGGDRSISSQQGVSQDEHDRGMDRDGEVRDAVNEKASGGAQTTKEPSPRKKSIHKAAGEEEYLFMADDDDHVFSDDLDDERSSESNFSYESDEDGSSGSSITRDSYREEEDEEELDDDFGSEHSEEEMIETLDAKSRDLFAAKFREKQMKDVATLHGQVSLDAFCVGSGVDVKTVLNTPNLYLLYKAST